VDLVDLAGDDPSIGLHGRAASPPHDVIDHRNRRLFGGVQPLEPLALAARYG
jgi:hypothetical protein